MDRMWQGLDARLDGAEAGSQAFWLSDLKNMVGILWRVQL